MKNLRKIRISLGMTSKALAKKSGLTEAAISQIETGKRDPSLKSILAIMKVIPCTFEVLTGFKK